jgi:hypothetical protein
MNSKILALIGIMVIILVFFMVLPKETTKTEINEPIIYSLDENQIQVKENTNEIEKEYEFEFNEPKYFIFILSNKEIEVIFNAEETEKQGNLYIINSLSNPLKFKIKLISENTLLEVFPVERNFFYALSEEQQTELIQLLNELELNDKQKITEIKETILE